MKGLLFAVALLLAVPPGDVRPEVDTGPGGFLDRLFNPAGKGDYPLPDRPSLLVILDPGHGGDDVGARNPGQPAEKELALRLARLIKQRLEKDGEIRALLTREEDTFLTPVERLEIANGQGALLYLSLHATGDGGASLLFVNAPQKPADPSAAGEWRYQNNRHDAANRRFAADLTAALKKRDGGAPEIRTVATPRLFLGGANLPAVMGEVIDLAAADEEQNRLADAVADAIRKSARRESSGVR
ncbi:MAG: N-acetylmuramoyl-L-alanine amidase [Nitrospinae bacterium]|nr:N-acetylmuramoyl-L-alanine amidase [Nitrospinota bacterium]